MDSKKASAEYYSRFQQESQELREQIACVNAANDFKTEVEALLQRIRALEVSFNQAAIYIPAYDQKMYIHTMRELTEALNDQQQSLKPRGKFTFKSRTKKDHPTNAKSPSGIVSSIGGSALKSTIRLQESGTVIKGRQKQFFKLEAKDLEASDDVLDVEVTDCSDCTIDLTDGNLKLAALHLSALRNCLVIAKPQTGSVLIENCHHSVFVLACHQFRMHNSSHVENYLYISSHPIIEDSQGIVFGRYGFFRREELEAYGFSGQNQFDQVDDFNWLRVQKSPNWTLSERIYERKAFNSAAYGHSNETPQ